MATWSVNGLKGLFSVLGCVMVVTLLYTISTDGLPFRRELLTPYVKLSLSISLCMISITRNVKKLLGFSWKMEFLFGKWKWVCREVNRFCKMSENSMEDEENWIGIGLAVESEVKVVNGHEIGRK